jgi:hypothetical protein
MLREDSPLIGYLPENQLELIEQGYYVLETIGADRNEKFSDYAFVVFPFAKVYEGFLKKIFLDAGYITREDYLSKYFRIGKVMSPNLRHRLGKESVYKKICDHVGCELSERIWKTWTRGRNQVFHFFPDNLRSLNLQEAEELIQGIIQTMEEVVMEIHIQDIRTKLSQLSTDEVKKLRDQKEEL